MVNSWGAALPPPFLLVLTVWTMMIQVGVAPPPTCIEPTMDFEKHTLSNGEVAWTCATPDTKNWNTGDRVIKSRCENLGMIEDEYVCENFEGE
ncbi:hypothetical protein Pcinc_014744 [Petrolisthes cinctipes]|uniref:Uncharacterized protein n=1 Tax=Petrolisthes cinctipes TaxID=88211 RepID=A0AAE1FWD4_PETCI|nr:hypothetical protein Pcinc_014744 [Petrolisthes cinctipes]